MRTDGGSAFPHDNQELGDKHRIAQPGMSLRDWFAGMAMQGLLACPGTNGPDGKPLTPDEYRRACVLTAYRYADSMLEARKT